MGLFKTRTAQAIVELFLELLSNGRIELELAAPAAQGAALELGPAALAGLREGEERAADAQFSLWPSSVLVKRLHDRTTAALWEVPSDPARYDPTRTAMPPVKRHTDGTSSMCFM